LIEVQLPSFNLEESNAFENEEQYLGDGQSNPIRFPVCGGKCIRARAAVLSPSEKRRNGSPSYVLQNLILIRDRLLMRFIGVENSLGFLLLLGASQFCCAQESRNSKPSHETKFSEKGFETPQATASRLIQAVNKQRWGDEYECYTGGQQARFTYRILVSTRELNDTPDLFAKKEGVLQRFQIPNSILERFPSLRSDLSNVSDPQQIQSALQDHQRQLQSRLELWQREVQPLNIEWAKLVEELQPIFVENFRLHEHEILHPSQNGVVSHLGFHQFGRITKVQIDGDHAEGSLFAIVRDPEFTIEENTDEGEPFQKKNGQLNAFFESLRKLASRETHIRRPPMRISFVRETAGWKIDLIPFR